MVLVWNLIVCIWFYIVAASACLFGIIRAQFGVMFTIKGMLIDLIFLNFDCYIWECCLNKFCVCSFSMEVFSCLFDTLIYPSTWEQVNYFCSSRCTICLALSWIWFLILDKSRTHLVDVALVIKACSLWDVQDEISRLIKHIHSFRHRFKFWNWIYLFLYHLGFAFAVVYLCYFLWHCNHLHTLSWIRWSTNDMTLQNLFSNF